MGNLFQVKGLPYRGKEKWDGSVKGAVPFPSHIVELPASGGRDCLHHGYLTHEGKETWLVDFAIHIDPLRGKGVNGDGYRCRLYQWTSYHKDVFCQWFLA